MILKDNTEAYQVKNEVENHIANAELSEALKKLIELTQRFLPHLVEDSLKKISNRYYQLTRDEITGILSYDNGAICKAQIVDSVFKLLKIVDIDLERNNQTPNEKYRSITWNNDLIDSRWNQMVKNAVTAFSLLVFSIIGNFIGFFTWGALGGVSGWIIGFLFNYLFVGFLLNYFFYRYLNTSLLLEYKNLFIAKITGAVLGWIIGYLVFVSVRFQNFEQFTLEVQMSLLGGTFDLVFGFITALGSGFKKRMKTSSG